MARCQRCDEKIPVGEAFTVNCYGRVILRTCSLVCIGLAIAEGWGHEFDSRPAVETPGPEG